LKQRGLLDSTLVIWAGEFGRTPMMQGNNGRNHNPYGFTIWMADGGVEAGTVIGSTDAIGLRAADQPQPLKNLHATILTALGLNPDLHLFESLGAESLSWRFDQISFALMATDYVALNVVLPMASN